ncbi:MAG: hypothetical protein ABIP88_04395 [Candidatus Binatia bacterium]
MKQSTPTDEVSRTKFGPQVISQPQREAEIERMAGEIGRLIQDSDPETREELAQSANSLLREQGLRPGLAPAGTEVVADARRRPLNPLTAGIGLIMIGAALTLLVPFVGLTVAACGVLATFWGVIISATRN